MKPKLILILTALQLLPALAGDKPTSGMRDADLPVVDKIKILERKLNFYRLMTSKKVDLEKSITATYKNKPLSEVFRELIPDIPVEFKGVDQDVTVESMTITKVSLDKVFQYLDEAAGVYFSFSEKGMLITAKPQ